MSGEDTESNRHSKWNILKEGNYQVLITTGQFFGEGTDLQNADCLFLVYPFAFEGKLIQYIGRVQRGEAVPTIYDFRDIKIDYLNKLFLKRNTYYRKLAKQATLFDDPEETEEVAILPRNKTFQVDETIKVLIEELEFRYGSIAFRFPIKEMDTELVFEIENLNIRPEFDVLKPFFTKVLRSKYVVVNVHAEYENNILVSQLSSSDDIERLDKEVVEGVRFRFVSKNYLNKKTLPTQSNLLDSTQIQENNKLYESAEELLQEILAQTKSRHKRQLRYLSEHHAGHLLKIRFTLSPFSFVFLIVGNEQFHIVLETLETEEATYLWHFDKNVQSLPYQLKKIDEQLGIIKTKGRQLFLETNPDNFSRIAHDYTDELKGFIIWKDLLISCLA